MKPSDPLPPSQTPSDESVPPTRDAIGPEGPSPLEPYFLRTSDVIAAALLAMAFLLSSIPPLWHSDVWAHLKFGQWIVQHRQLPAQEPFSPFTDRQPYIHYQWLSQVGMYLVFAAGERLAGGSELHRLAGGVGMLALLFTLLSFLRYLLLLLAYRRTSGSMPLACVGLLLVVLVGLFYGNMQRPQIVGELLFAALILALSRPVLSRRALVLIPILFVLWANLHGSYVVGLALLGVFFVGRILSVGRAAGSWDAKVIANDAQVRRLLLAGLSSTVAIAVLNPHGPLLFVHILRFTQNPNIATMGEWQSLLDFRRDLGPLWGYGLLCIAVIVTQILSPQLLPPTSLLLCALFGILPLFQLRMLGWWIVLVPWIVLPEWTQIGQRINWSWLQYRSRASGAKTLMAVLLSSVALLSPSVKWLRSGQPRPVERSLSPGTPWKLAAQLAADPGDKPYYPELADALKLHYPQGRFRGRIFATVTQGEYLLWALPAEYPVLMYTHAHLFPPEHWQDCLTVLAAELGWQEILDHYGVNLVVIEVELHPQLTEALQADTHWRIVVDETGLQQKADPRTRLLIAVRKTPL